MNSRLFPESEKYGLLKLQPQLIRLNTCPGGHNVWMWRDDPEDFAFGGNKVRFYEYLIPDIIKAAPDVLLTVGSLYSNHIRVSAEVASLLGMECHILITADDPGEEYLSAKNNLTLARSLGAKIVFAGSFAALLKLAEYQKELQEEGRKVFVVPNAGHTPGAVRAYADVMAEAMARFGEYGVSPSSVWLPCASGTTTSGVLSGVALLSAKGVRVPEVHAVAVGNTVKGAASGVAKLLRRAASSVPGIPENAGPADITDCGKNDYGRPDAELLKLRDELEKAEGIRLDPTYNINAFYGMCKELEKVPGTEPMLYINTGGFTG